MQFLKYLLYDKFNIMDAFNDKMESESNDSRKWTLDERYLFCENLTDPFNTFLEVLEKGALKKVSTKEVFEVIRTDLIEALKKEEFKEKMQ